MILSPKHQIKHLIVATSESSKEIFHLLFETGATTPGTQTAQLKKQFDELEMLQRRSGTMVPGFANLPSKARLQEPNCLVYQSDGCGSDLTTIFWHPTERKASIAKVPLISVE